MKILGFVLLVIGVIKLLILQVVTSSVTDITKIIDVSINEIKGILYFWAIDVVFEITCGLCIVCQSL